MDETIEERIKRFEDMDITEIPYSELNMMIKDIDSDLRFVEYKRKYYSDFMHKLRTARNRLRTKMLDTKDACEVCYNVCTTDKLRTLKDNRRVCKKCWAIEVCTTKLKNANNIMRGGADA